MYILFKTGMRISEFVGLTLNDVDLNNRTINIYHQLQRTRNMEYVIEPTKTNAGKRVLPMNDEAYKCFKNIMENRKKLKIEPSISDGNGKLYCGFLYLDKNNKPMVALHWEKYFHFAIMKYNKLYKEELPKITPHVCRHTY